MDLIINDLSKIESIVSNIERSLLKIRDSADRSLKVSPQLQELFTTLELVDPSLDELLSRLNTYLVEHARIDSKLNITPIIPILEITETLPYSSFLKIILSNIKIDEYLTTN
jgi:hypothetical protein